MKDGINKHMYVCTPVHVHVYACTHCTCVHGCNIPCTCTCMILHVCIVLLQLHVDCIDKNVHHSMNVCPQGASFSVCVFSFD